ncbi:hypothetical protein OAL14_04790 [Gammaproteobacteria bacterium]|nr:hypothetical protein [Gammaproteobacteria bacterium]
MINSRLMVVSLSVLFFLALIFFSPVIGNSASPTSTDRKVFFQYDFYWGPVPIAYLEIDFTVFNSDGLVKSMGETKGFSRIFKNYTAQVLTRKFDESARVYELLGRDRGAEEIRKISFKTGELPKVLEFKDSSSENSLTLRKNHDEESVDPLTVFSWFFGEELFSKECSKVFRVFDGKKTIYGQNRKIVTYFRISGVCIDKPGG